MNRYSEKPSRPTAKLARTSAAGTKLPPSSVAISGRATTIIPTAEGSTTSSHQPNAVRQPLAESDHVPLLAADDSSGVMVVISDTANSP